MNYKQIAEKYPKAWEKCQPYLTNSNNPRNLYDFFDAEGIIVEIRYFSLEKLFQYFILGTAFDRNIITPRPPFATRPEAEEQAFLKAR